MKGVVARCTAALARGREGKDGLATTRCHISAWEGAGRPHVKCRHAYSVGVDSMRLPVRADRGIWNTSWSGVSAEVDMVGLGVKAPAVMETCWKGVLSVGGFPCSRVEDSHRDNVRVRAIGQNGRATIRSLVPFMMNPESRLERGVVRRHPAGAVRPGEPPSSGSCSGDLLCNLGLRPMDDGHGRSSVRLWMLVWEPICRRGSKRPMKNEDSAGQGNRYEPMCQCVQRCEGCGEGKRGRRWLS